MNEKEKLIEEIASKVDVKFFRNHRDAKIPTYGSNGAAGFDFYSIEQYLIAPKEVVLIQTGLFMKIPEEYEIQVRPRSGMSLKTHLRVANSPGTIDSDYLGEICIIAENIGEEDIQVNTGDRVAQGVLNKVPQANFVEVYKQEDLGSTKRGTKGMGSTGV